jgi:hypothetical protein
MTMVSLVEKPVIVRIAAMHVERHVVAEEREERHRDQQIVNRRDDRADAEAELEAEREIGEDADQREAPSPAAPCCAAPARPPGRRSACRSP